MGYFPFSIYKLYIQLYFFDFISVRQLIIKEGCLINQHLKIKCYNYFRGIFSFQYLYYNIFFKINQCKTVNHQRWLSNKPTHQNSDIHKVKFHF